MAGSGTTWGSGGAARHARGGGIGRAGDLLVAGGGRMRWRRGLIYWSREEREKRSSSGWPGGSREGADCEGIDGGRWRSWVGSGRSEGIPRKIL